jgi:hypothetical protein
MTVPNTENIVLPEGVQFAIKISGIWETKQEIGLAVKFVPVVNHASNV